MVCCSLFLGGGRGVDNRLHYFSPNKSYHPLKYTSVRLSRCAGICMYPQETEDKQREDANADRPFSFLRRRSPPIYFYARITLDSPVNYSCTGCERLAHSSPATCCSLVMNPALVGETSSGRAVQIPGS